MGTKCYILNPLIFCMVEIRENSTKEVGQEKMTKKRNACHSRKHLILELDKSGTFQSGITKGLIHL